MPCTSSTTSNAEIARNPHAPFGFRRRGGICVVGAPRRWTRHRLRRAAWHLPPQRSERGRPPFSDKLLDRGFTLLEVLVALAVLGVGTALALSVVSSSLANIRKVQIKARTIQHAETVMETTLLDGSIKGPTVLQGDFADGTLWSVVVTEMQMPEPEMPVPAPNLNLQRQAVAVKALAYAVDVTEPGSRVPDVRIQTVKLVPNPVAPGVPAAGQLPGVGR